eukprot:4726719-Alexandrium_andersonii.AAC.1
MKAWQAKGTVASLDLAAASVHLVLPSSPSSSAPEGNFCLPSPPVPSAMAAPSSNPEVGAKA